MATTSRSTTVLAGLADIRGLAGRALPGPAPVCRRSLRHSWLFAQKMLEACEALNAAP